MGARIYISGTTWVEYLDLMRRNCINLMNLRAWFVVAFCCFVILALWQQIFIKVEPVRSKGGDITGAIVPLPESCAANPNLISVDGGEQSREAVPDIVDALQESPASVGVPVESPRAQALSKASGFTLSMPQRSIKEQAEAANILLQVSIITILDIRGDFIPIASGVPYNGPFPPETINLINNGRCYNVSIFEFPEFHEITEILRGRGKTVTASDPSAFGTSLDPLLKDQIALRYEEARGLALSVNY